MGAVPSERRPKRQLQYPRIARAGHLPDQRLRLCSSFVSLRREIHRIKLSLIENVVRLGGERGPGVLANLEVLEHSEPRP